MVWPWCMVDLAGNKNAPMYTHTHKHIVMNTPARLHTIQPCTSKWYSSPDCAPATSLGQCTATLCSGPGA